MAITLTTPDLTGKTIDGGRLRLIKVLGAGAYGTVYSAVDTLSPPSAPIFYAVKCLVKSRHSEAQHREFTLHARTSSHPNVVTLHRIVEDSQFLYVVLDFCDGGDLFGAITEQRLYHKNAEQVKHDFLQLCDALEHCHKKSVYHRDLKPENVLRSKDGRIFLADFGLATHENASKEFGCGSSFYMSPECLGSMIPYGMFSIYATRQSDLWSLGIILINMITGRNPWRQATPKDDCFVSYLEDADFLLSALPISLECNELLKGLLHLNPLSRTNIPALREEINALKSFWLSDEELAAATDNARAAAEWPAPQVSILSSMQENATLFVNEIVSEDSADSEEIYIFASPAAEVPHAVERVTYVSRADPFNFSIGSSSSSGSGSSSDDSEGPITPETHPVADDDLELEALDITDGPVEQLEEITPITKAYRTDLDWSPNTAAKLAGLAGSAEHTPRTTKAGVFRSAVQRLRAHV